MKITQAREALTLDEYNRGASIATSCRGAGYGPNITAGIAYRIGLADGKAAQRAETAKAYKRAKALEDELKVLRASDELRDQINDLLANPGPDRDIHEIEREVFGQESVPNDEPEQPTPGEAEELHLFRPGAEPQIEDGQEKEDETHA